MVSEETELNHYLEAHGVQAGGKRYGRKLIVQLAGEKPSHIIMPAIHKLRQQIATLFRQYPPASHQRRGRPDPDWPRALRENLKKPTSGFRGELCRGRNRHAVPGKGNEGNGRMHHRAGHAHRHHRYWRRWWKKNSAT